MNRVELRVHGVSGTPPETMLYTSPVSYDLGDRSAKVYEIHRDWFPVKGFHWGSLTAGRPHTAFWILLAPFAMANVAGWMSDRANPWTRALVRVAGLALTGVFFAQIANMTLHIPFQARLRHLERPEVWAGTLVAATATVTMLGLAIISTQSNFQRLSVLTRLRLVFSPLIGDMLPAEAQAATSGMWGDPTYGIRMISPSMWSPHALVHRLRRLHISCGGLILSLLVGAGVGNELLVRGSLAGLAFTVFLVLATTWIPESKLLALSPTALLPLAVVGWVGYASWVVLTTDLTRLTAADDITFGLAMILLVAALFALFGEWVKVGPTAGWAALGVLAVALLVGASLGLTGGLLVEDLLSTSPGLRTFARGGAWTALAMMGLAALLSLMASVMTLVPLPDERQAATEEAEAPPSKLRRIGSRARSLLVVAGIYGVTAGVATALAACATGPGCDRSRLPVPAWAAEDPAGAVDLAGLTFDLTSLLGWTKLVVVVTPALLILRSIVGGLLQGQEARRRVSIVWDIGSFWPRWFHPLAPPAYGPNAVTRLTEELEARSPMVLSAHSQGSLIAAAAITQVAGEHRPTLLITYGSPLAHLYPTLFPSVDLQGFVEETDRAIGRRWLNLWRRSDPIGSGAIERLGQRNWHVDKGSGHSRYELTPEFCAARRGGLAGDFQRPSDAQMADCWKQTEDPSSVN